MMSTYAGVQGFHWWRLVLISSAEDPEDRWILVIDDNIDESRWGTSMQAAMRYRV